jgi:hypothetical protein
MSISDSSLSVRDKQIKSHRKKLTQDSDSSKFNHSPEKQSAAKNFIHNDNFFNIKFQDLDSSDEFRHLKHGFLGENDFEDFKEELQILESVRPC